MLRQPREYCRLKPVLNSNTDLPVTHIQPLGWSSGPRIVAELDGTPERGM